MAYPPKPYDLLDSCVLTTLQTGGDATLSKGLITITKLGTKIPFFKIISFVQTAYAAGTLEVRTATLTSATPVVGVSQTLTIKTLGSNNSRTISVLPTTTVAADLKTLFITAINNSWSDIVTAASTGTNTFTVTEAVDIGGFILYFSDSGITVADTTPHVASSGTLPEVQQYDPSVTALVTGCTKYDIYAYADVQEAGTQAICQRQGHYIIWADAGATNYSTFNTALGTTILGGSDTITKYLAR